MASTTSPLPAFLLEDTGDIAMFANDYRVTRAVWLGSFAIVLYDWGLTLREEVRRIKRRKPQLLKLEKVRYLQRLRLGASKFIYIMNRYWPMSVFVYINIVLATPDVSDSFCKFFQISWAVVASPMHASIGAILILRIYVMYGCDKRLLWGLSAMLLGELVAELAILIPIAERMHRLVLPSAFTGCIPTWVGTNNWTYWVPMATFEVVLFVLAVVKSVQLARSESNTPRVLTVLLRDSVSWFGGVMIVILTNLIIWATARQSLFSVAIGLSGAAHSILGCRMLLNIHEAVQPTFNGNASIFAPNFTRSEQQNIPMRIIKTVTEYRSEDIAYEDATRSQW